MTAMTSPDSGRATKQLPVRLPADLYNALKGAAFYTDSSMNEIVVAAITEYLTTDSRRAELAEIVGRARTEYRDVLDKLADL
jgi:hypothetical protein